VTTANTANPATVAHNKEMDTACPVFILFFQNHKNMSDPTLRAQELQFVEEARGCNPGTWSLTPLDPAVYNGMDLAPQSTACSRPAPFDDACFYSWSWDVTRCTDMMPYSVQGVTATGTFMQISSLAASLGVEVGSPYQLSFGRTNKQGSCQYMLHAGRHKEAGVVNYTRLMRADPNDGTGGANKQATVTCQPAHSSRPAWESVWIARERFSGSFQSPLGIATFTLWLPELSSNPCAPGGASNPLPTLFGQSNFK